ncbi:MAG: hypothetical protein WBI63_02700 [Coriobacteriia bacterium]
MTPSDDGSIAVRKSRLVVLLLMAVASLGLLVGWNMLTSGPETVSQALSVLRRSDASFQTRDDAMVYLVERDDDSSVIQAIEMECRTSSDGAYVVQLFTVLTLADSSLSREALVRLMENENADLSVHAAFALGQRGDPIALPVLKAEEERARRDGEWQRAQEVQELIERLDGTQSD